MNGSAAARVSIESLGKPAASRNPVARTGAIFPFPGDSSLPIGAGPVIDDRMCRRFAGDSSLNLMKRSVCIRSCITGVHRSREFGCRSQRGSHRGTKVARGTRLRKLDENSRHRRDYDTETRMIRCRCLMPRPLSCLTGLCSRKRPVTHASLLTIAEITLPDGFRVRGSRSRRSLDPFLSTLQRRLGLECIGFRNHGTLMDINRFIPVGILNFNTVGNLRREKVKE